jgi:uncharacterized SAM-binding protein YcdF (DUF218 family)
MDAHVHLSAPAVQIQRLQLATKDLQNLTEKLLRLVSFILTGVIISAIIVLVTTIWLYARTTSETEKRKAVYVNLRQQVLEISGKQEENEAVILALRQELLNHILDGTIHWEGGSEVSDRDEDDSPREPENLYVAVEDVD